MQLPNGNDPQAHLEFAEYLQQIDRQVGMPMSARGWGYFMEGEGLINKDQLDVIENLINRYRKSGLLPVDFTAQEEGRQFSGVERPETVSVPLYMKRYLEAVLKCQEWYTPDWWDGEDYYIQMVVEKIDLKNLFSPICEEYHIPIATSKGWSSITQRAEYARRFKEAEDRGLVCVLLYCGDEDPDGERISQTLMKNLEDVKDITWKDGARGYNPRNLIIDRFGLNYDFIIENNLLWVNNLITGSGRNLASKSHKNHYMPYVQEYLQRIGERKVEANAMLKNRTAGEQLCRDAIEKYLGDDALDRFEEKRDQIREDAKDFRDSVGLDESIQKAIELIEDDE